MPEEKKPPDKAGPISPRRYVQPEPWKGDIKKEAEVRDAVEVVAVENKEIHALRRTIEGKCNPEPGTRIKPKPHVEVCTPKEDSPAGNSKRYVANVPRSFTNCKQEEETVSHHSRPAPVPLPPPPSNTPCAIPTSLGSRGKSKLVVAIQRLLGHSEALEAPEFTFDTSKEAAWKNFMRLVSNSFDLEKVINNGHKSVLTYGSEFKTTDLLETLLGNHHRWKELKSKLSGGLLSPLQRCTKMKE